MPTIGFEEVRRHNGSKSCWLVIRNDVYDVTKFLDSHPGGASSLLDFAGKDGTLAFETTGHSDDARSMMKKYKIGTLPVTEHSSHYKSCENGNKLVENRVEYMVYNVDAARPAKLPKSGYSTPKAATPRIEPRVKTVVVPRESSKLKWAILALASAIVVGLVLKKYMAK